MKKITTLEQAKSTITKETTETFHLGALNIGQESLDQETFDIMNWMFEDIPVSYTHLTLPTILLV